MSRSGEVYQGIHKNLSVQYPMLVPNTCGLKDALRYKVEEISIFGAASETFSQKNINCSIQESMERFRQVCQGAILVSPSIIIRGYISCILGCPYEGSAIKSSAVIDVMSQMLEMGCHEISLGDTIGVGTPGN